MSVKHGIVVFCSGLVLTGLSCVSVASPVTVQKYTIEHGVKVYRNAPSPAQIAHRQKLRQGLQARRQAAIARKRAQEAQRHQQRAVESAFERGYDRGYARAEQQARMQRKQARRNRYHYGRRYSTSYFGYPLNRYSRFGSALVSANPRQVR